MPTTKPEVEVSSKLSLPPVLSISPDEADHSFLHRIMDSAWTLIEARTLLSGLRALRENRVPIVLCECDLRPGTWRDILAQTPDLPHRPHLIVTSRLADEVLWAEALNLGAYDVLAKPFEVQEVQRVAAMAWQNWERENRTARCSIAPRPVVPAIKKSKKTLAAGESRFQSDSKRSFLIA